MESRNSSDVFNYTGYLLCRTSIIRNPNGAENYFGSGHSKYNTILDRIYGTYGTMEYKTDLGR